MLFVTGAREDRFPKAFAAGADVVCIDLEDAVAPEDKDAARERVFGWLDGGGAPQGCASPAVRLNGLTTRDGLRDALRLAALRTPLDWLLLPKVQSPWEIEALASWAPGCFKGLVALIETPRGVEAAGEIARAVRACSAGGVGALMLGGADLSMELGAPMGRTALAHARGSLVNAARAAELQVWDMPFLDLQDPAGLLEETRHALALGFSCKTAIHPSQVAGIHEAFQPSGAEQEWAQTLLAEHAQHRSGAFIFRGKLVDAPILRRARRIADLAQAVAAAA